MNEPCSNSESYNQLVWKISSKSVSGTSTTVEIAAYVAACVFNEGSSVFLTFMAEMGITSGPSAYQWANATDNLRINRADEKTALETKEGRKQRIQDQKEALDLLDDSNILYMDLALMILYRYFIRKSFKENFIQNFKLVSSNMSFLKPVTSVPKKLLNRSF